MKRFLLVSLFLFSSSLFAQATIDFETVGQDFVWTIFANGPQQDSTDYAVVPNPSVSGLNTSSHVGRYMVRANADPWSGIWTDSIDSFTLTADNAMIKVLVYKDVISNFNLKLEGFAGVHDNNVPNTVTNQWEELVFDYTADIGKTVTRMTIIPDFPSARTAGSMNYFDRIQFIEPVVPTIPTIDFETVGNSWVWNLFSAGTGGTSEITANPSVGGLNTSANCLKIVVGPNGDPWAGVYCTDFPDMLITAENCIVKVLVYKDVTSRFNLKLEPPNVDHFYSNTVINQWEELTFDYSSDIGTTGITLTLIPDMEDGPRTHASVNYIDNIRFTPQVVPVELTSFSGAFVGNNVELKWATATELNNRGFEIQRSINGSAFATVAFVEGRGTTTQIQQYSFTDRNIESRVNYAYRLKQIDYNGDYEFSQVVNIGFTLPLEFVLEQNYPNPFNPSTSIAYAVPVKSNVTLEVYNLIGQKIVTLVEGQVEAGKHTAQFNASSMSSGIYLFKLTAVGENGSQFSSSKKMTLLK